MELSTLYQPEHGILFLVAVEFSSNTKLIEESIKFAQRKGSKLQRRVVAEEISPQRSGIRSLSHVLKFLSLLNSLSYALAKLHALLNVTYKKYARKHKHPGVLFSFRFSFAIFKFQSFARWGDLPYYRKVCGPEASGINMPGRTTLDGWLARWALHLSEMKRFTDLPLYLQYLCKILFHVIDRTSKFTFHPIVSLFTISCFFV